MKFKKLFGKHTITERQCSSCKKPESECVTLLELPNGEYVCDSCVNNTVPVAHHSVNSNQLEELFESFFHPSAPPDDEVIPVDVLQPGRMRIRLKDEYRKPRLIRETIIITREYADDDMDDDF